MSLLLGDRGPFWARAGKPPDSGVVRRRSTAPQLVSKTRGGLRAHTRAHATNVKQRNIHHSEHAGLLATSRQPPKERRQDDQTASLSSFARERAMARPSAVSEVELHPLVLLSVVDHYYRVVSRRRARARTRKHAAVPPPTSCPPGNVAADAAD